jgi:hypothetical protein
VRGRAPLIPLSRVHGQEIHCEFLFLDCPKHGRGITAARESRAKLVDFAVALEFSHAATDAVYSHAQDARYLFGYQSLWSIPQTLQNAMLLLRDAILDGSFKRLRGLWIAAVSVRRDVEQRSHSLRLMLCS